MKLATADSISDGAHFPLLTYDAALRKGVGHTIPSVGPKATAVTNAVLAHVAHSLDDRRRDDTTSERQH